MNKVMKMRVTCVQDLLDNGFRQCGAWSNEHCVVHTIDFIQGKRGVYAFVDGEEIAYYGESGRKNAKLEDRLERYSSRCFKPSPGAAPLRPPHSGILGALKNGRVVRVFALITNDHQWIEKELIKVNRPKWNRQGCR
jgi:hypothetical protein